MVYAYVFIITAAGKSPEAIASVRELDGVVEAHVVAGEYDIVVEFEVDSVYDLLTRITEEIQSLPGVGRTRTYIALD